MTVDYLIIGMVKRNMFWILIFILRQGMLGTSQTTFESPAIFVVLNVGNTRVFLDVSGSK